MKQSGMERRLRSVARRILTRAERACARARTCLDQQSRQLPVGGAIQQVERPNHAKEWEQVYANESVTPVTKLSSPVALALEALTKPGDALLEAGCGSATISAELATAGRRVELADFSQTILDRALRLFNMSHLAPPSTHRCDITKGLPMPTKAVDTVWSSGVLEHWTDEELVPIIREMARVSRKSVVAFVPYAGSVFYRWGKWVAEKNGTWPYGRELPRESLRGVFERAGLTNIQESTLSSEEALYYLQFIDPLLSFKAASWWSELHPDDFLRQSQGYLLSTAGCII